MITLPIMYYSRVITVAVVDDNMSYLTNLTWHARIMKPLLRRACGDPSVVIALLKEEPDFHAQLYPRTRVCDALWLNLCHIVLRPQLLALLGLSKYTIQLREQIIHIRDSVGPHIYHDRDRRNCCAENLHEIAPRFPS